MLSKARIARITVINLSLVLWLTPREPDAWYFTVMIPAIMAETIAAITVINWLAIKFQSIRGCGQGDDEESGTPYITDSRR